MDNSPLSPIYPALKGLLNDEGHCRPLEEASETLEQLKESRSEKAEGAKVGEQRKLYPDLAGLEETSSSESSSDEEDETEQLQEALDEILQRMEAIGRKKEKKKVMQRMRGEKMAALPSCGEKSTRKAEVPFLSAPAPPSWPPPPYADTSLSSESLGGSQSFCPDVWKEALGVSPVFLDANMTHAANFPQEISSYLQGNWSRGFDAPVTELRIAIVNVNSTRVDLTVAEGLSTWIHQAMNHLKEWAGLGSMMFILAGLSALCLCLILRLVRARNRDLALVAQAMYALEAGQSPQAWLSVLKN